MTTRMLFRVYLDTGAVLEFKADDMKTKTLGGKLESVDWPNVTGNAPRWIDIERIVAITREIK